MVTTRYVALTSCLGYGLATRSEGIYRYANWAGKSLKAFYYNLGC